MPRAPHRHPHAGSTLVGALAVLEGLDAPAAVDGFAPRLARWVDWTDAISLAAMLGEPPQRSVAVAAATRPAVDAHLREVARVRGALASRVREVAAEADDANWRPRYAACQQAMQTRIGPLRASLRAALAAGPPPLAKLAELDAVMEGVLAPREQALLATVAGRLAAVVVDRRDHPPTQDDDARPSIASFRADIETLLLAELDLRLQPVDALLGALRSAA